MKVDKKFFEFIKYNPNLVVVEKTATWGFLCSDVLHVYEGNKIKFTCTREIHSHGFDYFLEADNEDHAAEIYREFQESVYAEV